jgi:hypothetical protein
MVLEVVGLAIASAILALGLLLARFWSSLPPDPAFRRQLAFWLALLAVVSFLYSTWAVRSGAYRRLSVSPLLPLPPGGRLPR